MTRVQFTLIFALCTAGIGCSGGDSGKNDAGSPDVCSGCDLARGEIPGDLPGDGLAIPGDGLTDVAQLPDEIVAGDTPSVELDAGGELPDQSDHVELPPDILEGDVEELGEVESPLPDLSNEGAACGEVLECVIDTDCSWEDEQCIASCDGSASALAAWKLGKLTNCYQNHCAGSPPAASFNCLSQYCTLEMMGCVGGDGELACGEVVECLTTCPPGSGSCRLACMGMAGAETIAKAYEIVEQGGFNAFQVWLMDCLGGEGDLDCAATHDCLFGCGLGVPGSPLDQLCVIQCDKQASAEAKSMWLEMMACCEVEVDPSFLVVCLGGGGEDSCFSAVACWHECNPEIPECYNECFKQIAADAVEEVHNFFACLEEICPTDFIPACDLTEDCIPACMGEDVPGGN